MKFLEKVLIKNLGGFLDKIPEAIAEVIYGGITGWLGKYMKNSLRYFLNSYTYKRNGKIEGKG